MNILTIEAVVAVERNQWGIGAGNELLWRLPKDMKRFREITKGGAVIMGTKTALSVGKALPKRINYVLTRSGKAPYEGQIPVASMQEAVNHLASLSEVDGRQVHLYVLGGEEVYTHTLPYLTGIHLTVVYSGEAVQPDRFFPMGALIALHEFQFPIEIANTPEGVVMDGVDETIPTNYLFSTWPAIRGPALLSLPKGWRLGGYRTMDQ
jgi:dihydrofolate reductase